MDPAFPKLPLPPKYSECFTVRGIEKYEYLAQAKCRSIYQVQGSRVVIEDYRGIASRYYWTKPLESYPYTGHKSGEF